jgi:hypothetical protein
MSEAINPYEQGHLMVAALRLFIHREGRPPSVRDLSDMLEISTETGHYLCNRLEHLGAVKVIEAAFDEKVYLADHLKLEELPKEEKASTFEAEVQEYKEGRERQQEEIKQRRALHEDKKKDLFSDLEKQLKEGLHKPKKNPLDDL